MNRRLLVIAITLAALFLGSALAQEDNLLQRFDLAIENLDIAVASVPNDGVQARDELERALNALLTLSTNATSPTLVQAMERTFDRTRVAIENQSQTDMAVQTSVLAGGFARLIMDSAYTAAANGDTDLARARLLHLAQHLDFGAEATQALQEATDASAMRFAFEAGAADTIAAQVRAAEALAATDQSAAYEQLAAAYGRSLLVQDSPRVGPDMNRALVDAANALVSGDAAGATAALQGADAHLVNLGAAARGQVTATPIDTTATPTLEQLPDTAPSADQPTVPAPQQEGVPADPADASGEAATAPTPDTQTEPTEETAILPLLAGPDLETAVQQRLEELEAEREAATLAVLSRELTLAGVPAALANTEAEQLLASGYDSLNAALAEVEAATTRVVAAQRSGDVAGARAEIADIRRVYNSALAPLVRAADASTGAATEELLASLTTRTNLTSHDVTLLAAQTSALRSTLLGGPAPAGQELEMTVDSFWSTLTRPVVLVILALLAIVPLVLLNLAFGGSNRNWRLVGWALFLLLLPVFFEGLAALAGLVAGFVALPWLAAVSSWSSSSSTVAFVVWAALVALALILAIVGLYGICVQFGLLGSSKQRAVAASSPSPERRPTGNTTIDWDEEF
ncbi:MAG: hypothetical protein WDA03_03980 [Trueperaceae bacterium]